MRIHLPSVLLRPFATLRASLLVACPGSGSNNSQDGTPNRPPTINGGPTAEVSTGANYSFVPVSADADGDMLTFDIQGLPSWASFDTTTGALSGVPGLVDVGTHGGIVISVSDSEHTVDLAQFAITVSDASGPPPAGDYVGFGAATSGADSCPGIVTEYRVTSLTGSSGIGTLRDAVSEDCRIIKFDVAGNIDIGNLQISNSYLTIDGFSAPAPGIC